MQRRPQALGRRPREGVRVLAFQHGTVPAREVSRGQLAVGAAPEVEQRPLVVGQVVLGEVVERAREQARFQRAGRGDDPAGALVVLLPDPRDLAVVAQVVAGGVRSGGFPRGRRARRGGPRAAEQRGAQRQDAGHQQCSRRSITPSSRPCSGGSWTLIPRVAARVKATARRPRRSSPIAGSCSEDAAPPWSQLGGQRRLAGQDQANRQAGPQIDPAPASTPDKAIAVVRPVNGERSGRTACA